jgi:hypothetical protein
MLGNTIVPSRNQLPPGKAMWDAWKKSGDAKHLMKDVAEGYTGPLMKFLKAGELAGSYTIQQLQALGFKQSANGAWYIPMEVWQKLVSTGQIRENFADGKNPQDKGDSKRHGVPTKSSVSNLRKFAKSHSGRAAQLAHWMANMKSGKRKKTNEDAMVDVISPGLVADWDDDAGQIRYTKNNVVIPYGTAEYNAARAQHIEYRKNQKYNQFKKATEPIYNQVRDAFEKEQQSPTKPGAAIDVPQELFPQDKIKPPVDYKKYGDPTDDDFIAEDYGVINEVFVGSIFLPNVELSVNDHAYDQADKRRINYELIDQSVKKVNSVVPELSKFGPMEQVYVYDPATKISLGLSRLRSRFLVFGLITVINGRPHPNGRTAIIDIPSTATVGKPTGSFVNIGQNTVRKITQAPTEPVVKKITSPSIPRSGGGAHLPDHKHNKYKADQKPDVLQIAPKLLR